MTDSGENKEDKSNPLSAGSGRLRTRGVVRTRGFVPMHSPAFSSDEVSMRGAIRTRGGVGLSREKAHWPVLTDLSELVHRIRVEYLEGFPLTVVIENTEKSEDVGFIQEVRGSLGHDDRVWIRAHGSQEKAEDGYLNVDDDRDKAFTRTLVADILFVVASDNGKLTKTLEGWKQRARAVVAVMHTAAPEVETESELRFALQLDRIESHSPTAWHHDIL